MKMTNLAGAVVAVATALSCASAIGQDTMRPDSRNLSANYRIFTDEMPPLEDYIVIRRDDEVLVRELDECPDQVQIGGVQIEAEDERLQGLGPIETRTGVFNTTVSVHCQ